jgi:hypothetical protein
MSSNLSVDRVYHSHDNEVGKLSSYFHFDGILVNNSINYIGLAIKYCSVTEKKYVQKIGSCFQELLLQVIEMS